MTPLRNRSTKLPSLVATVLAVASIAILASQPAAAQSDDASPCTTGGAVSDGVNNPGLVSDCEVLLVARDTLAGTATLNWSADVRIATWDGVTIGGTPQRITKLLLGDKGLNGEIPEELGTLTSLRELNLFLNQLTGEIPSTLGNLSNLNSLTISWNPLTGDIPEKLGNLSNLRSLDLSWNGLTGQIPTELGSLADLEHLALQTNQLTDEVPRELGNLTKLKNLDLSRNKLTGEIPEELGNLTKLKSLDLSRNKLTGEIPDELGNLTKLKSLDLSRNKLTGEIPDELGKLISLEVLYVRGNRFPGCVTEVVRQLIANLISSDLSHLPACTGFYVVHTGRAAPQMYNANVFVLPVEEELATADRLPLQDYVGHFFEYFDDEFVFLIIVSNLDSFAGQISPTRYAGRHYFIKNDVQGIGRSLFSYAEGWGSAGALQGVLHLSYMDALSRGPLLHELMHRWANFIVPTGIDVGGHWGFSSANGQLGGFDITDLVDHGDGRYSAGRIVRWGWRAHLQPYSPIELYLAGLIQPEEVPDLWVAEDGQYLLNENGFCVSADDGDCMFTASIVRTYTIEDIIAEHGERVPNYSQSQRDFRAAAILLVDEDHPLLKWQLDKVSSDINSFSYQGADEYQDTYNFYEATGGRAMITLDGLSRFLKDSVPASLPGTPTDLTAKGIDLPGIDLSWIAPASDGFSAIVTYDLRFIETSADETVDSGWTVVEDVWTNDSDTFEYTLAGLTAHTEYVLQLRAVNTVGEGPWSESARATTGELSICVTGGSVSDVTNAGLISDCEALLEGRDTLVGAATLNWSEDTPITQWNGVGLGGTPQRVTRLELAGKGLDGMVSSELGRLSKLTYLNLRSNELTGEIPDELDDLSNLRVLNLHSNSLSGGIPDLSGMTSLEELYLPNNADYNTDGSKVQGSGLTGGIPTWLNGMTNMRELWLWGNSLSGSIPNLSGMTSLKKLKLANNDLTGGVPGGSMLPPNMTWLIIDRNPLGGTIPDLSGLTRLRLLWLHTNMLEGQIPAGDMLPASLDDLNLRDNMLAGTIPDLSGLDRLTRLRLHNNSLIGEVPATLGGLDSLKYLWLHNEVDKGLGKNSFTSIAAGVGGLGDTLIQIALNGNPWDADTCVPAELANVVKNDYTTAGIEVCPTDDGS